MVPREYPRKHREQMAYLQGVIKESLIRHLFTKVEAELGITKHEP